MMSNLFQNRILRAYGSSVLGVFSGLLTSFWLLREVTQVVSAREFGIYAFAFQITSYLAVLQLGLDFAASREIAARIGRNDYAGANAAFAELHCFNRRVSLGVALLVVVSAITIMLANWHGRSPEEAALIGQVILIAGGAQVVATLSRPYSAALVGGMKQVVTNLVQLASGVVTAIVAYVFLRAGLGVLCLPAAALLVGCLTLLFLRYQARLRCHWLSKGHKLRSPEVLREMIRFGGLSTVGGIAWSIEATSDVILLGWLGNTEMVAIYVLWWRFPQMLFDFCTRLATSAFPEFANRGSQDSELAGALLCKVGAVSALLAPLACLGIGIWLPTFVHLWVGSKFALADGKSVALLMGLLVLLRTWGNLLGMFALAQGDAKFTATLSWAQALTKIGLGVLLVRSHGLQGLLFASCICAGLQVAVFAMYFLKAGLLSWVHLVVTSGLTIASVASARFLTPPAQFASYSWFAFGACLTVTAWGAVWAIAMLGARWAVSTKNGFRCAS